MRSAKLAPGAASCGTGTRGAHWGPLEPDWERGSELLAAHSPSHSAELPGALHV